MDQQAKGGMGLQVALGMIGFFLLGGLSLAGGNGMTTSLVRGAIGLFGFFALGFLLSFAMRTLVRPPRDSETEDEDHRGAQIDIVLPEETVTGEDGAVRDRIAEDEFVPLSHTLKAQPELTEDEARKYAEALRHLSE